MTPAAPPKRRRPPGTAGIEQSLVAHHRFEKALGARLDQDYLATNYRNFLYGGWRHPKGHLVTKPHEGLLRFHEAAKALFCPVCCRCEKHNILCECGTVSDICRVHVGQAPTSEDALVTCPTHGDMPWRSASFYSTLCSFPANGWAKSSGGIAEFASWILGHRPWDGTLTAPAHQSWTWIAVCQNLTTSSRLNIEPKIEQTLAGHILSRHKNSSGNTDFYEVRTPWGVDRLKIASQDQHAHSGQRTSPYEGAEWHGVWYDEPIDASIRGAIGRGLRAGLNCGWGRELMTATFFQGNVEQRVYIYDELWNKSHRRGGPDKGLFVMTGSIHENPALTAEDKRIIIARYPPSERAARTWGFYEEMSGRIYSEFHPDTHVFDDRYHNVLVTADGKEPSNWPIYMAIDPHDIRPWVMLWVAVAPEGPQYGIYVVREWPSQDFAQMDHYSNAGVDNSYRQYAEIIRQVEDNLPGGSGRVVRRFMDPGFGGAEKTGTPGLVQDQLADMGYWFETDFTRSLEDRHLAVRKFLVGSFRKGTPVDTLHRPHLAVARSCQNTVRAFMGYAWDSRKGKPAERGKDHMDCLGFIAVNDPTHMPWDSHREASRARAQARADEMGNRYTW